FTHTPRSLLELSRRCFIRTKSPLEGNLSHRIPGHVKPHRQRGITFNKRVCGELRVRISSRPLLKTSQVEMLILERVSQLMSHDRLLAFEINPIGEKELLLLRIEIARHLLCQKTNQKWTIVEIGRSHAKLLHRLLSSM